MRILTTDRRPAGSPAVRPDQPVRLPSRRRGLAGRLAAVLVGAVLVLGATGCFAGAPSGPPPEPRSEGLAQQLPQGAIPALL